jgi:serine protease DegQ
VILEIDNRGIQGRGDLNAYLSVLDPSASVSLEVWRNGETQTIRLKSSALPSSVIDMTIENILGISLQVKSKEIFVNQISKEGAFARYRLKAGDQIVAINGQKIRSISDLETIIANLKSEHKGSAIFTIRRGNSQGQVEMPI